MGTVNITLCMKKQLLKKVDQRVAELHISRSEYLRNLFWQDLEKRVENESA